MSLYLGSEIFDIYRQPLQGEFSHLFVRQGNIMRAIMSISETIPHIILSNARSIYRKKIRILGLFIILV